jgi:hypothetical protein
MDAPAFDTRFVRPPLTIHRFLFIGRRISLMMTVKLAHFGILIAR